MTDPYFSIITPTYNRADTIGSAIESVLNQDFLDFEHIIVDDGSTDNTQEIVNSFIDSRIKYFKKENGERGAARNFGISKAKGQYICFLDSDDIYYSNHLTEAIKFISKNKNVSFFFQNHEIKLSNGNIIKQRKFYNDNVIARISNNNFLGILGAFIKTDIAKNNLFDEDPKFNIAEDLYVWLKIGIRYDIKFSSVYTSCVCHHSNRTMENIDPKKLFYCTNKLIFLLNEDKEFSKHPNLISLIYASHLSLCSLYYSIQNNKVKSIKFLLKSCLVSFKSLFKKRTLVILKNIILKW